jgi:chromosome segregation ATPase
MIKIVTREHWRNLVDERNNAINELKKAQDDFTTYSLEISQLMEENKAIGDQILDLEVKLDSKNAEIKKLKALLTKNKIDYKHLYKGGK